jgi:hypothetical protein
MLRDAGPAVAADSSLAAHAGRQWHIWNHECKTRTQRSLLLREWKEIQTVPSADRRAGALLSHRLRPGRTASSGCGREARVRGDEAHGGRNHRGAP